MSVERVAFITAETGDDLVLSFAVQCPDDPSEIESLILMRTPKFEFILEEHERGPKASFERHDDDEDEEEMLTRVAYVEADAMVRIQASSWEYELDVRKVSADELREMRELLRRLNFDRKFETSGV
jgi:hypothetical protein